MKRINIQRDVESRRSIARELPAIPETEPVVEPEKEGQDAESETLREDEADTSSGSGSQAKKRRRKAGGNV